ncbi:hypothetical protein M3Y96_01131300 [Aphelenchoides besseyi]|nr:hypothetical protein M3Y96_01131300 [Aphelenchoides besseyi]
MIRVLALSILCSLTSAEFFSVHGKLRCSSCRDCGPIEGKISLWEQDELSADDFQDETTIKDGKYESLKFYEFEWLTTTPYLSIQHSCDPSFWHNGKRIPEKTSCYVDSRHYFSEPTMREIEVSLDLTSLGGDVVCEDK